MRRVTGASATAARAGEAAADLPPAGPAACVQDRAEERRASPGRPLPRGAISRAGAGQRRRESRSAFVERLRGVQRSLALGVSAAIIGTVLPTPARAEPAGSAGGQARQAETASASPEPIPPPPALPGRELWVTLEDGRRVNLFPSPHELSRLSAGRSLATGPVRTSDVAAPHKSGNLPPDPGLDTLLAGVPASARSQPWTASFDDYFRARAALQEVPTALAGLALQPVAEHGYRLVDRIPAPIRRPFDRALGILLENAAALPSNLLTSRVLVDGGPLPASASAPLNAYPQIRNSCGETMIATWLKGQGVPIALGEVDTQLPFAEGTNLLEDQELRRRGFSLISGPGSMRDLRTYVAHGYPVMVSVGWEDGGGHYAVVTGYDEATRTLSIAGWNADGQVARVPYAEFETAWARHLRLMTVAHPQRDTRLDALRRAGQVSREAEVQEGLSLSEIWVTRRLELFIETAYRYRGTRDDLVVRLNLNTSEREHGLANMLGGSVRYTHRLDDGTRVELYAEHVSTKGPADAASVEAFLRSSALYLGVNTGALHARVGYDRGAFQAALQADLSRRLFQLGGEARVSVDPAGNYRVFLGLQGTF